MTRIGTPLSPTATRVLLCGCGELGKEVVIELQRLGVEVIAVDRYADAPAMQVAHRSHVINMPPDLLSTGEHFALEVRGDSMIEAGILDGDIALIGKSEGAETGDIVVALIDDEEATLKRFRRRGASIALEPANTAYEVRILPPNRVRIQGKLVGLFRRY